MGSNKTSYGAKAFGVGLLSVVLCVLILCFVAPYSIDWSAIRTEEQNSDNAVSNAESSDEKEESFEVLSVVDGDTIRIDYYGKEELVRLIGINTPEVDGPYTEKECYGDESSAFAKTKLSGQWVTIEADSTQGDRDKYNRLLRYVALGGEDFGKLSISQGYAFEYTYNNPYLKQNEYKVAQEEAKNASRGLWRGCVDSLDIVNESAEQKTDHVYSEEGDCNIKGNISISTGEKIYHVPGQEYYEDTVISPEYGERWFCSEEEAMAAGWRKSKSAFISGYIPNSSVGTNSANNSDTSDVSNGGNFNDTESSDKGVVEAEDKSYSVVGENGDKGDKGDNNSVSVKTNKIHRNIVEWLIFLIIVIIEVLPILGIIGVIIEAIRENSYSLIIGSGIFAIILGVWIFLQCKVFFGF